ncbi:UNVERIFIED_CONTAM: hypothetical protein H355_004391 [Colinus virginianus]|nr:hypothetical protein H355_004391 [Colinus virginianus]
MVNQMDVFHRILSGILAGRDTVIGLSVLALVVSGVLWWLYYDYRNDPSTELETEKENVKFLFGYAIFSTVVTVVLLSLILVLRKRVQFTVQLFQIVGKIIGRISFLLFQPLWTFLILIIFWVFWVAVMLSLGTAGTAQTTSEGQVEYRAFSGICYMAWYHFVGLIWTSEFILACQQMTIAGAVVTCYFNRLSMQIYRDTEQVENGERMHVYTTTAINGTNFCTSAKDAVFILGKSSAELASVSCFGDFIIFLGKVRVRKAVLFLSVFEVTLDTMFLCFAIDMETNDGSAERPYFVDQELLMFVNQNNKSTDRQKHRSMRRDSEDGTELQPMVRQECGLGT